MDAADKVRNQLATTKRYLAAIILKQKDEIERLGKELKHWNKNLEKEMKIMSIMEGSPLYQKQVRKVSLLNQKISATEEAVAQYKMNLVELGVEV